MEIRCRANSSFAGMDFEVRRGEIVTVDPVAWAVYIERGYLTPIDDAPVPFGLDNPRVENDGSLDTSGSDGWPDGPLVGSTVDAPAAPMSESDTLEPGEVNADNYARWGDGEGVKFGLPTALDVVAGDPPDDDEEPALGDRPPLEGR